MPRNPVVQFNPLLVSETDWIRLAAFIDGEGTICLSCPKKNYWSLRIQISNTDPRLMVWLKTTFLGTVAPIRPSKKTHKPAFIWAVTCAHAEVVLRGFEKYLLLKGEQARLGLAYRETFMVGKNKLTQEDISIRSEIRSKIVKLNKRGVDVAA